MSIRPLFDRILIKRVEEATRSAGGLFLPETAKEKPAEGEVLAGLVGHQVAGQGGEVEGGVLPGGGGGAWCLGGL